MYVFITHSPFSEHPSLTSFIYNSAEWTVFSLRMAKDATTLTRIRSARIAGTEGSMGTLLQGDCAVIPQHGGKLVVWNYMTDEWAQMVDEFEEDDRTVTVSISFRASLSRLTLMTIPFRSFPLPTPPISL